MVRDYSSWLDKRPCARILDIGPVCDVSINYFLPRLAQYHVCDLFLRFTLRSKDRTHEDIIARELDYTPESFDGIHFWDIIDHLSDETAAGLIKKGHALLKPGGMILIVAYNEYAVRQETCSFAVADTDTLRLKPQQHIELPCLHRHSRDILALMKPFGLVNSFAYTLGIREFLFRKGAAGNTNHRQASRRTV